MIALFSLTYTPPRQDDITKNNRPQWLLISPHDTMADSRTSCRPTSQHSPCKPLHSHSHTHVNINLVSIKALCQEVSKSVMRRPETYASYSLVQDSGKQKLPLRCRQWLCEQIREIGRRVFLGNTYCLGSASFTHSMIANAIMFLAQG